MDGWMKVSNFTAKQANNNTSLAGNILNVPPNMNVFIRWPWPCTSQSWGEMSSSWWPVTTWPGPGATSGEIRENQEILNLSSGGKESTMLRGMLGNTWLSWLPATTQSSPMVTQLGEKDSTFTSFCPKKEEEKKRKQISLIQQGDEWNT